MSAAAPSLPFALRPAPLLRPGVRLGPYPQQALAHEDRHERALTRLLMPLHRPAAARRKQWPAFVGEIETAGRVLQTLNDAALDRFTHDLRRRMRHAHLARGHVTRAFALVREVARRELGLAHYDEQLIGGWILLEGMLAEMATGEGKTLCATLPACAAALAGIPVHVVTVNDYLVARDAARMGPIYRRLGLRVGAVTATMDDAARRAGYRADVTYCCNKQLVFDYLRDRRLTANAPDDLRLRLDGLCTPRRRADGLFLRGLYYAIVDEADSVFIDEARTPLILAAANSDAGEATLYRQALFLAGQLRAAEDYSCAAGARHVLLTARGQARLATMGEPLGGWWAGERRRETLVTQALAARECYRRDREYLVQDGKIVVVDEQTGRAMPDRSWEQGLHQMIEAKEGVALTGRQETLARISYQRFFQRYLRLGGMSGTLREVRGELRRVYGARVVAVPTHRPSQLRRTAETWCRDAGEKWTAIIAAIARERAAGRPVLAGTRSVADSELLSRQLGEAGVAHRVLNARQDAEEAAIVASAGEAARVTVATNMAGRGTDIELGAGVAERGGLHVIVCERNESRRVDRQLIGRAGRQGDPGSYEYIGALDDELLKTALGERLIAALARRRGGVPGRFAALLFALAQRLAGFRHRRTRRALLALDESRADLTAFAGRSE
jgi:preprotein translocase subunit SecA